MNHWIQTSGVGRRSWLDTHTYKHIHFQNNIESSAIIISCVKEIVQWWEILHASYDTFSQRMKRYYSIEIYLKIWIHEFMHIIFLINSKMFKFYWAIYLIFRISIKNMRKLVVIHVKVLPLLGTVVTSNEHYPLHKNINSCSHTSAGFALESKSCWSVTTSLSFCAEGFSQGHPR